MPASLKTQNFDFPLYQPQDSFAPLTDFNLLSSGVDRNLMIVKTAADSAEAMSSANEMDIQELETWKAGLMQQLDSVLNTYSIQFNNLPVGVESGNIYNTIISNLFFIQFNIYVNLNNCQSTPISDVSSIYTVLTTPHRFFSNNISPNNAVIVSLLSVEIPHSGDSYTVPSLLRMWQDNNITYFGIVAKNTDELITLNRLMNIWGCGFARIDKTIV